MQIYPTSFANIKIRRTRQNERERTKRGKKEKREKENGRRIYVFLLYKRERIERKYDGWHVNHANLKATRNSVTERIVNFTRS